jgi:hypothetical protein
LDRCSGGGNSAHWGVCSRQRGSSSPTTPAHDARQCAVLPRAPRPPPPTHTHTHARTHIQAAWPDHKAVHKQAAANGSSGSGSGGWAFCTRRGRGRSDAMPLFGWTGPLRPARIGPMRQVCGMAGVGGTPAAGRVGGLLGVEVVCCAGLRAPCAAAAPPACLLLALRHATHPAALHTQVPEHIARPDYAATGYPTSEVESRQQRAVATRSAAELAGIRAACRCGGCVAPRGVCGGARRVRGRAGGGWWAVRGGGFCRGGGVMGVAHCGPCSGGHALSHAHASHRAHRVGRQVLDAAHAAVAPGVTTDELDRVVRCRTLRGAASEATPPLPLPCGLLRRPHAWHAWAGRGDTSRARARAPARTHATRPRDNALTRASTGA